MPSRKDKPPLTLLTFAPMVDSEFSRLVLAHYGLAYHERDHLLQKASPLTLFYGGQFQVPLLYGKGIRLTGPRAIANQYDRQAAPERKLLPDDPASARQVEEDMKTYNGGLALATARFAYFHLLPLRELMSGIFAKVLPPAEAKHARADYPTLEAMLRTLLLISRARAEAALEQIRAVFANTDARIADGRRYLCGDHVTLGDLALASAAAPLLSPPGYGAKMPALGLMPAPLRIPLAELRARPTAEFVRRLYAEGMPAARATG